MTLLAYNNAVRKRRSILETDLSNQQTYSLEQLSQMTGISRRTIRFYIQKNLLPPPCGEKRGSYYTDEHLETLLKIKRLSGKHVPLKEIKTYREEETANSEPAVGSISVCTHICLGKGLTLVVDSQKAKISADKLRTLAEEICQVVDKLNDIGD